MTLALSVVTSTRNRAQVLRRCLEALATQSLDPARYEVIVADDASSDNTPAVIDAAQRQARVAIRPLRLPQRSGVAGSRNRAIPAARGEIIVFVDDDSLAPPGFLDAHLKAHAAPSTNGIICRGPVIATRSLDSPFEGRASLLDISTAYFDTDNGSVRRDLLLRAGLFDEQFFPYGWEGLDLGVRLRELGLRRVFRRDAALYHYQPELSPANLEAMLTKEDERARTARLFYAKHPTFEARLAVQLTLFHLGLNAAQRAFGLVHAGNVEAWFARTRRWGVPGAGRLLLRGVLNERYLARLWAEAGVPQRVHGD
jgi:glycosyltransferase involved in cell wall biosynthesis